MYILLEILGMWLLAATFGAIVLHDVKQAISKLIPITIN